PRLRSLPSRQPCVRPPGRKKGRWRPISPDPFLDFQTPVPEMGAGVLVRIRLLRCFDDRVHRYVGASVGFPSECYGPAAERKERVVTTQADIGAGMPGGAALARDDVAGDDDLAAEFLHAEAFRFRVTTVARRAASFLVCHGSAPSAALLL